MTIRITEYLYSGSDGEFIEFTNLGLDSIDLTGWSFDDDSRLPDTVDLSGFGEVAPGESVILTEASADAFRLAWNIAPTVKIIGNLTTNLGRNDEINVFDASDALVDRLTFGDQTFPGTLRTQNASGWVAPADAGTNDIARWTLASVGDVQGSYASTGGDIGNPGQFSTAITLLLNEINVNPPGTDNNQEYIELRGTPDAALTGYYLVAFEGDFSSAGQTGIADVVVDLSASRLGSNGLLIVQNGGYTVAPETTVVTDTQLTGAGGLENGTISFLLMQSAVPLTEGTDYDVDNDGVLELPSGAVIVDAVGWSDGGATDLVYGGVVLTQSSGTPDAATRFVDNLTANAAAAWYAGDLLADGRTYDASAATANLPGGAGLTPGAPNGGGSTGSGAAPTIAEASATPFLNLPETGAGVVSGVLGDPTDPARTVGIDFAIADADTDLSSLSVTVSSNNPAVVADANLTLSGSGATRNLKIDPTGVGLATIVVTVSDGSQTASYTIQYAASAASVNPTTTRFHTGGSDASTAIALDDTLMLVAIDEDQTIRLYDRTQSGLPLKSFDLTSALGLVGNDEVDIEASTRVGDRIYWLGSHSNESDGDLSANRYRVFATDLSGSGLNTTLTVVGFYSGLRADLIAWGDANGYNLSASAAEGNLPEDPELDGFNLEGLTIAPDGTTAYLAFRAPSVPTSDRTRALIAPVTNLSDLITGAATTATLAAPIELDLGGRGIRSIERNASGEYLIVAGPADSATGVPPKDFRLYRWTGQPTDAPTLLEADLTALNAGGSFEAIVSLPNDLTAGGTLQLLVDNGDTDWYGTGAESKDLADNIQKFRSELITLNPVVQPQALVINEVVVNHVGADTSEYVEFLGAANTDYSAYTLIQLEGDSNSPVGTIDSVFRLGSTDAAGYLTTGFRDNVYENGTISLLLVKDFTGSVGTDLDPDNDGVLDVTPWSAVVDSVAISDGGAGDRTYSPVVLTPNFDGQSLTPGGASRIPNGQDTDSPADWVRNNFNLVGIPTFGGTAAIGEALNTPGAANVLVTPTPGVTLTQTGGTTQVNEADPTATDTYTLALNTDPIGAVNIQVESDGQTEISQDGVNFFTRLTVTLSTTAAATITVRAVNDTEVEGPHASTLTHTILSSDDPAYSNTLTPIANLSVDVLDNDVSLPISRISAIQGTGTTANLLGSTVAIEGIVVGDFQGATGLNGFYVQEEDADADGDSFTSEGIFVFAPNAIDVKVGDKVSLTGVVSEAFGQTQLSTLSRLEVVAQNQLSLVTPTPIDLSVTPNVGTALERYEGMLVTFPQTLTVTEHFQLDQFGQIVLSSRGVQQQPTDVLDPNDVSADGTTSSGNSNGAAIANLQALNSASRIILDDGSDVAYPSTVPYVNRTPGEPATLRIGSTFSDLTGVLGFGFGAYRVQRNPDDPTDGLNTAYALDVTYAPRPEVPTINGRLKVASFNVLNYFTDIDNGVNEARGADSAAEFQRQQAKIVAALLELDADVVGLIEIQNNGNQAIANLVTALNAIAGAGTYAFINDPAGYTSLPGGTDAIKVGFIYKPGAVTPIGNALASDDAAFGSARAPVAQTFMENATGEVFTPIINHFKSKSSSAGLPGDTDQGDGQGLSNASRKAQAEALLNFVNTVVIPQAADGDVMLLGDFNAYSQEDPMDILRAGGYTKLDTPAGYLFGGQVGSLDHALVNNSLLGQVTGATKWAINAFEPDALDYNDAIVDPGEGPSDPRRNDATLYQPDPFRSSDHDPVLVGLSLAGTYTVRNGKNGRDILIGTNGHDQITGFQGKDLLFGGKGRDRFVYVNTRDQGDIILDFEAGQDRIVLKPLFQSLKRSLDFDGAIEGGYLRFDRRGNATTLRLDADGTRGRGRAVDFITVLSVTPGELNQATNFVF